MSHAQKTHLPLARLTRHAPTPVAVAPDAEAQATLADELGLLRLKKLDLRGEVRPKRARDWTLEATIRATVTQACVVTQAPVTTRIEETVIRHYVSDYTAPAGEEDEMPEDDTVEPLPAEIDLFDILAEALALALPLYPRAEGADLGVAVFAAPGVRPMTDEDAKPLAGLAALRDQLAAGQSAGNDDENEEES